MMTLAGRKKHRVQEPRRLSTANPEPAGFV